MGSKPVLKVRKTSLKVGKIRRICFYMGLVYFVLNCFITATIESESISQNDSFHNDHKFSRTTSPTPVPTNQTLADEARSLWSAIKKDLTESAREQFGKPISSNPVYNNTINPNIAALVSSMLLKRAGYAGTISPSYELQAGMKNVGSSIQQFFDAIGNLLQLTRHLTFKNVMLFMKKSRLTFTEWFFVVFVPSAIIAIIIQFVNPVVFLTAVSLGIFGHAITTYLDGDLSKPEVSYKVPYGPAASYNPAYNPAGEGPYAAIPYGGANPPQVLQMPVYPTSYAAPPMMMAYPNPMQYPAQRLASLAAAYAAHAYGHVMGETTTLASS